MTQDITVKVPDTFTAEEKKAVQEFAAIKVERIIKANNPAIDETKKEANEDEVDAVLKAMSLDAKYTKEEVKEEPIAVEK